MIESGMKWPAAKKDRGREVNFGPFSDACICCVFIFSAPAQQGVASMGPVDACLGSAESSAR
jgi:hypothetical protein